LFRASDLVLRICPFRGVGPRAASSSISSLSRSFSANSFTPRQPDDHLLFIFREFFHGGEEDSILWSAQKLRVHLKLFREGVSFPSNIVSAEAGWKYPAPSLRKAEIGLGDK